MVKLSIRVDTETPATLVVIHPVQLDRKVLL